MPEIILLESTIRMPQFGIRIVERVEFPIIRVDRLGIHNLTNPSNFLARNYPLSEFPSSTFGVPTHGLGTSP